MDGSSEAPNAIASPTFSNPPVVETALGIQFEELKGFKTAHFGMFHQRIASDLPEVQDHPRLPQIVETFPRATHIPALSFGNAAAPQRVWYLDRRDGSELVQLQPDRFGFNWRRSAQDAPYPRYSENSRRCLQTFARFVDFCRETPSLGEVQATLCEVVYVNHIWPLSSETAISLFAKVFAGINWQHSDKYLPQPEAAALNRTFVMEEKRGRLYAEASIAAEKERGQYVSFRLISRLLLVKADDVGESLQRAHDWVVNGFVSLTDPGIRRERWGQKA